MYDFELSSLANKHTTTTTTTTLGLFLTLSSDASGLDVSFTYKFSLT